MKNKLINIKTDTSEILVPIYQNRRQKLKMQ
jgi:hypothetical protein